MLFDRGFGNDAFFLVAALQAACDCWMFSMGWMWHWSSCGSGPPWDGGSVPTVVPCWSVPRGLFICGAVLEAPCRQWSSVVPWLTNWADGPSLAVARGPRPARQPSHRPYGTVGWSLVPPVLSLPVTWFAQGLTLPWWLASDDCVPSGYFCETWATLHWGASVWNTPIQQWFSFSSGLEMCEKFCLYTSSSVTCIQFNPVHRCWWWSAFHPKLF